MIFQPDLLAKILNGQKTETRRSIKEDVHRCRYRVGYDYAVQPGRGREAVARLVVLATSRERLGDVSIGSVRREGFDTHDEFVACWRKLHGGLYDVKQEVWAIRFVLLGNDSSDS